MNRFLKQFSGKLLCLDCARELSSRAAKFHVLHCKTRPLITGRVVCDGYQITEERGQSYAQMMTKREADQ